MRKNTLSLVFLVLCSGCGTSPEPDYYSLAPVTGAPLMIASSLKIIRPSLPSYLDRPEIVRQQGDYGVEIDEESRWAEPLDTMFERILAEDLRQRLPASRIVTEQDDALAAPRFTLDNDVEQFNDTDNGIILKTYMSLRDAEACGQPVTISEEVKIPATQDGIAGLSETVGKLADTVAQKMVQAAAVPCATP